MVECGVIVLAGGRSSRMGADKAQVRVNGVRLVDALLASLPAEMPRVVVSPFDLGFETVSEAPPFGGPVAGIAAGAKALATPLIAVLAVDAPESVRLVPQLIEAVTTPGGSGALPDVAVVMDDEGHLQPLCGVWRAASLSTALEAVNPRDAAAKALLRAAGSVVTVRGDGSERDYDTPQQLAELGEIELR